MQLPLMHRLPCPWSSSGRQSSLPSTKRAHAWRVSHRMRLSASVNLDDLALDMPDIDGDLSGVKRELGGELDEHGVALSFNFARQAVQGVESGVVIVDRSHWGRLRLAGEGARAFCHNQSTNDFNRLGPGQGCDTVFVTSTARTLDLATALVFRESVMLLVHPSMKQQLAQRFDKYIFPADKVKVQDVSRNTCMLSLIGPDAGAVLKEVAGDTVQPILNAPHGSHLLIGFRNTPLIVVSGSGLSYPGYTLICEESMGGELFALLSSKGCILMGENEWEAVRVLSGRPAPGSELTEDVNPLEAGLYHAVSLDKGCYIGQETLSKLANLDGVKQQLWGLTLDQQVPVGAEVTAVEAIGEGEAGTRLGRVTSVTTTPDDTHHALAYLKCKSKGKQVDLAGARVHVGGVKGTVVPIPYASRTFSHQLPIEVAGPGAEARLKASEEERKAKAEAAAKAAEEKAAKLRAMQERLAAWQAQQAAHQQQQAADTSSKRES